MNELGEVRDGGTQTVQEGRLLFLNDFVIGEIRYIYLKIPLDDMGLSI